MTSVIGRRRRHARRPPGGRGDHGRVERDVVALDDPSACHPSVVGGKAAALARAGRAGLPVLPGYVVTTTTRTTSGGSQDVTVPTEVLDRLVELTGWWTGPMIVRSSAAVEDGSVRSMAGAFDTVHDVTPAGLGAAVQAVVRSAVRTTGPVAGDPADAASMAVLVQPQVAVDVGGVLFTTDPVTGTGRAVAAVHGSLAPLVGGLVRGTEFRMTTRGRVLPPSTVDPALLSARRLRRLAALARRAVAVAGAPQDIEWAYDDADRLWLLQLRPITAAARTTAATGPLLGGGPVAETLPGRLGALERDLWVEPLRQAVRTTLEISGAVPPSAIAASPLVTTVADQVVADLDLLGAFRRAVGLRDRLDPRAAARRLVGGWRAGRIRAAYLDLATEILVATDRRLAEVPAPERLSDDQLVSLLSGARRALVSVHGHEMLAGQILDRRAGGSGVAVAGPAVSAAGAALRVLHRERAAGRTDEEIIAAHPVVLSLVPPRIDQNRQLPEVTAAGLPPCDPGPPVVVLREALRLRVRWLHELTTRAAIELGRRLVARGQLDEAADIRTVPLASLVDHLRHGTALERVPLDRHRPDLPACFRLDQDGRVIPAMAPGTAPQGAGGGVGIGALHHGDDGPPPADSVLVVRALTPDLAVHLPRLAGLVSETGSVLSHLAILAREAGVPTVVGVPGSVASLPPGTRVAVDGQAGTVTVLAHTRQPNLVP